MQGSDLVVQRSGRTAAEGPDVPHGVPTDRGRGYMGGLGSGESTACSGAVLKCLVARARGLDEVLLEYV